MESVGNRIAEAIRSVPRGSVASYGAIAAAAGLTNGARTVARVLHSSSTSRDLPWWRIVRADGSIALPRGGGYEEQAALLVAEGLFIGPDGRVHPEQAS
ncbi:MAG: DNA methyltransferase [Spirochaetales bacterium]|nr:MAG: DNA methyltransferase [Spirochaetales bacterium]